MGKTWIMWILAGMMGLLMGCGTGYYRYNSSREAVHVSHAKIIPIYIDSGFSKEHIIAIKEATKEWNGIFNGQVELRIMGDKFEGLEGGKKLYREKIEVTGEGWVILGLNHDNEMVEDMDGVLAFVRGPGGHLMVVIKDVIGTRDLKTIVMHEMGHLMGAYHVNMASLMIPYYSNLQYECIDKVTVMQVAYYMKLNFNSLNYCIVPGQE